MPTSTGAKFRHATAIYSYSPILCLVTDDLSSYPFTVDSGTDTITATGHDFVNGTPVTVANTGGGLPEGLGNTITYFVINAATNTFKLSTTIAGSAVDITSVGSGINTVTEAEILDIETQYQDHSIVWDVLVRREVASYQGDSRKTFTWGSPVFTAIAGQVKLPLAEPAIIPINDNIEAKYFVIIKDGTTTRGDSTGSVEMYQRISVSAITTQGIKAKIEPVIL